MAADVKSDRTVSRVHNLRDPITRVTINAAAVTARLRGNMVCAGPR